MKKIVCGAVLSLASSTVLAAPSPATDSFAVNASVQGSCVILNSNNLPFGLYNPVTIEGSPEIGAESSISIRCTNGLTNVSVFLSEGENASGVSTCAQPHRQLISEERNLINYQIYQDEQRIKIWGCDENNAQNIAKFVSSIVPVTLHTFSLIPGGQNIAKGKYVDVINVSVRF